MKHETAQVILSFLGGCAAFLLGGFDTLLMALAVVMIVNYLTGTLKAIKQEKWSPVIGLWGIVNMVVVLLVVVVVNFVQIAIKMPLPIRESVIAMLLLNQTLSALGNAGTFVKGLEPIVKYFDVVRIRAIKIFVVEEK